MRKAKLGLWVLAGAVLAAAVCATVRVSSGPGPEAAEWWLDRLMSQRDGRPGFPIGAVVEAYCNLGQLQRAEGIALAWDRRKDGLRLPERINDALRALHLKRKAPSGFRCVSKEPWEAIALAYAARGELAGTIRSIKRIGYNLEAEKAYCEAAVIFHMAGKEAASRECIRLAVAVADAGKDEYERMEQRCSVAGWLLESGENAQALALARETLTELDDRRLQAWFCDRLLLYDMDKAAAHECVQAAESHMNPDIPNFDLYCYGLVRSMVKAGELDAAARVANRFPDVRGLSPYPDLAETHLRAGDFAAAEEAARKIIKPNTRVQAQCSIAEHLIKNGGKARSLSGY